MLDLFSAYALQGVVLCNNVLSLLPDRFLKDVSDASDCVCLEVTSVCL